MSSKKENPNRACYGEWAFVAGAAEGVGAAFSEVLAQNGISLVMVDIKQEVLRDVALRLQAKYGIQTREAVLDLVEKKEAVAKCMELIREKRCRLLVYVPAYSQIKPFTDHSGNELDRYIGLNINTPLHLIHEFSRDHMDEKKAGIILMSSLAGMIGPRYSGPYAGTKAFSITLAESLFYELKEKNIDILTCCAGPIDTPTFWSSKPVIRGNWPGVSSPMLVAEQALKNLGKKPVCILGWKNSVSFFLLTRIFSRGFAVKIVAKSMKKMYPRFRENK
jgi:uncharacterized protein